MFRECANLTNYLKLKKQLCMLECKIFLNATEHEAVIVQLSDDDQQFLIDEMNKSDAFALESFLRRMQYQGLDQSLGDYVEALFQHDFVHAGSVFVDLDLEHAPLDRLQNINDKVNEAYNKVLSQTAETLQLDLREIAFQRGLQALIDNAKHRINLALAELISLEGYEILAVNSQHIEVKRKTEIKTSVPQTTQALSQQTRRWCRHDQGLAVNYSFKYCS